MHKYAAKALEQGQKLEALMDKVSEVRARRKEAADRVFYSMQDAFTFQQGENIVQNLVFNIPQSEDFEAVRFTLYPFWRRLDLAPVSPDDFSTRTSDITFRPTVWAFQDIGVATQAVDALIEMNVASGSGFTRRYQNAAFLVHQTFSGYTSPALQFFNGLGSLVDRSESPSALVFDPSWYLEKGSTLTARITVLFSGERIGGEEEEELFTNEYQIRGVLEGYKRTRR